jgi:hypothetical protein
LKTSLLHHRQDERDDDCSLGFRPQLKLISFQENDFLYLVKSLVSCKGNRE